MYYSLSTRRKPLPKPSVGKGMKAENTCDNIENSPPVLLYAPQTLKALDHSHPFLFTLESGYSTLIASLDLTCLGVPTCT